ncbi:centrosomal protein of 112 kDa isoform X1 [Conger conger]|uniref:centrosomal protein of 112 kDa isoform X1 n=1 Tax=Conger conger TaxID=82655 RepID=UPI002A59B57B|nr:centrosomal protein of 112 kDa isoform X1 [Conger conger]XP_061080172.1 centrosomal protein of 112 kDa isoform X1 [Conger conger]
MSQQEDSWEKLDSEFDHHLVDMKPYVLKLPGKSERQRCALWIKKLCDPAVSSGSGLTARKNRNMYARLLLHMLRRGVLEGPFIHKPDVGPLKTLPTYMAIYFDEPLFGGSVEQSPAILPDWVSSELGNSEETWASTSRETVTPTATSSPHTHRRRHTYGDKLPARTQASRALTQSASEEDQTNDRCRVQARVQSSGDSDLEARLNSWNLGIEKPRYLREKPIPLSPICLKTSRGKNRTYSDDQAVFHTQQKEGELKAKVLEARYQEERLKMQQRHDADVQKILDRKNGEIEELKAMYRTKQKDSEETVCKLEKKVQSLVRESQVVRENRDEQIAELKKMLDNNADSVKNEWETKLHTAVTEMEQEKFELQKKHTENIQELLDDTNQRLAKMEAEYSTQTQATEQVVKELEGRVKQLSLEVENGNVLRQKVTQEKAELEIQIASISSELQESNRRAITLLMENEELVNSHEKTVQKMQAKQEADMSFLQQEQALSAAKASDVIVDLEQCVAQLRQQLQDCENKRTKQLREQESKSSDLLHATEKKVRSLQKEVEKEKVDAKKKMSKMEEALTEKEDQLCRQRECHRQQMQQAESALEQFKKQAELSSEKAFTDMKQQMEKVEADLIRSKGLREKQAKEFSWQLEELRQRYEQQIVELKMQQEQERTQLYERHNGEKDGLVQDHRREIQSLEKQSLAAMVQHQAQTQEWRNRDSQSITQLEAQVHSLREDLLQAHAQRKQQLMELGVLREEERQRAAQEQEATLGRLRAEMERLKQDLERTHAADKQLALEKSNAKVKQVEKECSQKLARSSQALVELQAGVYAAQEEVRLQRQEAERQQQEARAQWEDERRRIIRDSDRATQALQEKVEGLQKQLHGVERKLRSQELETQEQVTQIRQECEVKIKGLMPAALRQELEDTITSLKSQVSFLQKRAAVLQEDLDVYRSRR